MKSVVEEAQEKAKDIPKGLSKRSRTANIRQYRSEEIELIDEKEAWSLATEKTSKPLIDTEHVPNTGQSTENERKYVPPPQPIETLRKLRQERLKNEQ
jgi:hypothetical protein